MNDAPGPSRFGYGLGLAGLILAADQASKHWILAGVRLPEVGQIPVLPFFGLTFVKNYGVSFGLLKAGSDFERWLLVGLSGLIATIFLLWMRTTTRLLAATSLGLVVGGAIGNMIDRARFGYVVDFLDFSGLWRPHFFNYVFNVADAAITVGALLLIVDFMLYGEEPRPKSAEKQGEGRS
jgi:signal peptidase II